MACCEVNLYLYTYIVWNYGTLLTFQALSFLKLLLLLLLLEVHFNYPNRILGRGLLTFLWILFHLYLRDTFYV